MTPPTTPWVLLRGLTRERGHWGDFPALLAERLGHPPLLAIDLPGNGARHRERSPASVAAMADDCRAELARAGLAAPQARMRVLAMSLGAMVTVAWAAKWPHEIDRGVLVNTSLRPFSPWFHRLQPRAWPAVLRTAAGLENDAAAEAAVLALTSRRVAADPAARAAVLAQWRALRAAHPVARGNALRQLGAAARFSAPRAAPHPRLLLLASARDGLVDPRCSRALAAAWHLPLVEHPSAGHDLPLDDGPWVAEQIASWLDRGASH